MQNNITIFAKPKAKVDLKNSLLILIAFATAFFPRILHAIGFPSVIDFLHFGIVPLATGIVLFTSKTKDRTQIAIAWEIIYGLLLMFGMMTLSALINHAGVVNLFLEFLLFAEPLMLLIAIACTPISPANLAKLKRWLIIFSIINLVLALAQFFLLSAGIMHVQKMSLPDEVQGVFYLTGAGNYVSCTVSMNVAIYLLITAKKIPLWIRLFGLLTAFYQVLASDSKQVFLTLLLGWLLLLLTNASKFQKFLKYLIIISIALFAIIWSIDNLNIEGFEAYRYWASRTELYGPHGVAITTKTAAIPIILSYCKSPLNLLFGLGPGHTVGRLGGWFIPENLPLLRHVGVTVHPVSAAVWDAAYGSWLFLESSMFSPLFDWIGLLGDIGIIGLGSYLYIAWIMWRRLCRDDFSKYLVLCAAIFGFILTQMEEPGYMLSVAILVGVQWHEQRIKKQLSQR